MNLLPNNGDINYAEVLNAQRRTKDIQGQTSNRHNEYFQAVRTAMTTSFYRIQIKDRSLFRLQQTQAHRHSARHDHHCEIKTGGQTVLC